MKLAATIILAVISSSLPSCKQGSNPVKVSHKASMKPNTVSVECVKFAFSPEREYPGSSKITMYGQRQRDAIIEAYQKHEKVEVISLSPIEAKVTESERFSFGDDEFAGTFSEGDESYTIIIKNMKFAGHAIDRVEIYDGCSLYLEGSESLNANYILSFRLIDGDGARVNP